MANGIPQGGQGTFKAELLDNGLPVSIPSTSTWQWASSDPAATITPDPSDSTGGLVQVAVPAGDANTTITVTASTTASDSSTVNGFLTVPVLTSPHIFTVRVTQPA